MLFQTFFLLWNKNIYTLTGHFIRYTLLVPGWTSFCLPNCLNSLWNRLNKVLETFLRDFGPYWHDSITQLLQICRLHIHDATLPFHHIPKVLIGLRSGDCGGHLSKVNSLSCSRNQSEMISALWHGVVYCWKKPSEDGYTVVIKGWTWSATISPAPLHHHHQPEPLRQGRMDPCFHVLYAKFWLYHLNAAEIKTHQTRQHFFNLLLSNVGEPVWIVASVSCS